MVAFPSLPRLLSFFISLPTLGYEEGGIELIATDSIAADPPGNAALPS